MIVVLLAGMKAGVFQTEDIAGLHCGDRAFGDLADAVVGKADRPADDGRDRGSNRLERFLGVAAFGPAVMRQQHDLAALVGDLGDGRHVALDAGDIRHFAVVHRHVEVDADKDAFAFDVGVFEGREGLHGGARIGKDTQPSLPIATAVSIMRLEKPHSLSYHDITRTSVPSITLVWSMWKTAECGSWLKSLETLGASV